MGRVRIHNDAEELDFMNAHFIGHQRDWDPVSLLGTAVQVPRQTHDWF